MDFSRLSTVLRFAIMAVVYIIIFLALRIMYKDIKGGEKKKPAKKKAFGLEVIEAGQNPNLKEGSIVPIHGELTIGRKNTNNLVLEDQFVSGNHVRIFLRNTDYMLEDLGSTNGTKVNEQRLEERVILKVGDEIEVGSAVFKVIG
ncbi:FHA domain-containing protein [Clostridium swellfunianum]|uniref:FHA domain-containing protein n=1 Tax=Clostridium swellfunianum TaxID=1367462 RepID=UPI00202EDE3E|nr:FHA domain-containing protein [Clostridium swellfunianum]MCM0651057.1 FHA domain-containing protein [Clostridium swellfunianum]